MAAKNDFGDSYISELEQLRKELASVENQKQLNIIDSKATLSFMSRELEYKKTMLKIRKARNKINYNSSYSKLRILNKTANITQKEISALNYRLKTLNEILNKI